MPLFPHIDPIPLPAPVWLFKALHILTLSLHFVAVQILLGGLLLAVLLNVGGQKFAVWRGASAVLARRLPIVMTYVINLGVPPLLFVQVLYGPFLYTSNVLIGAYWISIIGLLMACYWFLYGFADGASAGKSVWWKGLIAWLLAGCISRILSTNMALMVQPEVWPAMYAASGVGAKIPPYDPTLTPRWVFMLLGAGWGSGLWLLWLAGRKSVEASVQKFLAGLGGTVAALAVGAQAVPFYLFFKRQPAAVLDGIQRNMFLNGVMHAWPVLAGGIFLFALWAAYAKPARRWVGTVAALLTVLTVATWTIVRDGVRDLLLNGKGFDVWQQPVAANWSVVLIFVLVLVIGVAAVVWLISVVARSKPMAEGGAG